MKIDGVEITEAQIKASVTRMLAGPFFSSVIEDAQKNAGPKRAGLALRAAARLLRLKRSVQRDEDTLLRSIEAHAKYVQVLAVIRQEIGPPSGWQEVEL